MGMSPLLRQAMSRGQAAGNMGKKEQRKNEAAAKKAGIEGQKEDDLALAENTAREEGLSKIGSDISANVEVGTPSIEVAPVKLDMASTGVHPRLGALSQEGPEPTPSQEPTGALAAGGDHELSEEDRKRMLALQNRVGNMGGHRAGGYGRGRMS